MEVFGYKPTALELTLLSLGIGVAAATVSLVINLAWEAFRHCTGKFTPHGVRRCVACMEPAEPGSSLCAKHSQLSNMVRRRRTDRAA